MLIVMGFAGGLEPGARAGEIVIAKELRGPCGERVSCTHEPLLEEALARNGISARRGVIACAPRPVLGHARARLHGEGAIAADMESLWLAQGAREGFAVLRVIADGPREGISLPWRSLARFRDACRALRRAGAALERFASVERSCRVGDALGFERPPNPRASPSRTGRG